MFSERAKMAIFMPKYFPNFFSTWGWILIFAVFGRVPWTWLSINEMRA